MLSFCTFHCVRVGFSSTRRVCQQSTLLEGKQCCSDTWRTAGVSMWMFLAVLIHLHLLLSAEHCSLGVLLHYRSQHFILVVVNEIRKTKPPACLGISAASWRPTSSSPSGRTPVLRNPTSTTVKAFSSRPFFLEISFFGQPTNTLTLFAPRGVPAACVQKGRSIVAFGRTGAFLASALPCPLLSLGTHHSPIIGRVRAHKVECKLRHEREAVFSLPFVFLRLRLPNARASKSIPVRSAWNPLCLADLEAFPLPPSQAIRARAFFFRSSWHVPDPSEWLYRKYCAVRWRDLLTPPYAGFRNVPERAPVVLPFLRCNIRRVRRFALSGLNLRPRF